MSTISGNRVKTFAEASHAQVEGMHMNADYPFMIPRVVRIEGADVILKDGEEGGFRIRKIGDQEHCVIEQSSSFEAIYKRKPMRFKAFPFKDERTPAVSA